MHNLLISTSGFPWFKQALDGDGRAAFKALTDHYKGPAHQNLSAAEADAILETLHWKNEFIYPFDTYLTNLTKVFKSKQDANEEVPETMKVKEMLKRMKTDNPAVLACMALVRLKHPDDFKSAGEEMATQITQIFLRSKHEREKSGYSRKGRSLQWNVTVSEFVSKMMVEAVMVAAEAEEEEVTTGTRTI